MKRIYSIPLVTLTAFILMIALYFIFSPIFYRSWDEMLYHNLSTYTDARNYYNVIASAYSIFTTTIGICLGLYYFFRKNKIDGENKLKERRIKRIDSIHQQLNIYDEIIDDIFSLDIKSNEELEKKRSKLTRAFEHITVILEADGCVIKWNDEELEAILKVNSFVDTHSVIMDETYAELSQNKKLKEIKYDYIYHLQEARRVCIEKADSFYS